MSAALLIADETQLPRDAHVWGTGGWLPPAEREALDWLTLLRLLGIRTRVVAPADLPTLSIAPETQWIIDTAAADPELLHTELQRRPLCLITRVPGAPYERSDLTGAIGTTKEISGRSLRWPGSEPAVEWRCREPITARELQLCGASAAVTLDTVPCVSLKRSAQSVVVGLGFDPSLARDQAGVVTRLLRHLLMATAPRPAACLDFDRTMILRMDDPGGSQNVHFRAWSHRKLDWPAWLGIGEELERRSATLSVAYVCGWVDDGDAERGDLRIDGGAVARVPGAVHAAPRVCYQDRNGFAPGTTHDYAEEYSAIQELRARGLADVELHGYTHLHPDSAAWSVAADRYESIRWFRELGSAATAAIAARPDDSHPLLLGCAALRRHFGVAPTTLISPGDEWTNDVLCKALSLGLTLIDSYYLALRHEDRFCWAQHVCAPYFDQAADHWFDAPLPVIGYLHDRDIAVEPAGWFGRQLDAWEQAGARRMISFRSLAAALALSIEVRADPEEVRVTVTSDGAYVGHQPQPLLLRLDAGRPAQVDVVLNGTVHTVPVVWRDDGLGQLALPVA